MLSVVASTDDVAVGARLRPRMTRGSGKLSRSIGLGVPGRSAYRRSFADLRPSDAWDAAICRWQALLGRALRPHPFTYVACTARPDRICGDNGLSGVVQAVHPACQALGASRFSGGSPQRVANCRAERPRRNRADRCNVLSNVHRVWTVRGASLWQRFVSRTQTAFCFARYRSGAERLRWQSSHQATLPMLNSNSFCATIDLRPRPLSHNPSTQP